MLVLDVLVTDKINKTCKSARFYRYTGFS